MTTAGAGAGGRWGYFHMITAGLGLGEGDRPAAVGADLADDAVEHLGRDGGVHRHGHERRAALGVAAHLHARDVDAGLAEYAADDADDARPVGIPQERQVRAR